MFRIFDLSSNCKQNQKLMHLFCDAWRRNFIFLGDLKIKLCKHNQKDVEWVHYVKVYTTGVLKNGFLYEETSDANLLCQLRLKSLTHQRDFNVKYTHNILLFSYFLVSVPLCLMFKALAFQRLCLVPNNIDFALSWTKCTLNLLATSQSHKLEKSFSSCFSISVTFPCWKTMLQVSSA